MNLEMVLIFLREWSNESHNHVGFPVSRPRHLVRKLLVGICALCVLFLWDHTKCGMALINGTNVLSHTWVRYPGFRAMGFSAQYWSWWFQDFPAIWILGSVPCQKNVWIKLFRGEIKFFQRRPRSVKYLLWQIAPMHESTNEWKNNGIYGTQW